MSLLSYIQGRRKGKEAHRIEREAMTDPFLAEALEGLESVAGNHAEAVRRMQRQIEDASRTRRNIMLWASIAASVLILIGIGWYFLAGDTSRVTVLSETAPKPASPTELEMVEVDTVSEQPQEEPKPSAAKQGSRVLRHEPPPVKTPTMKDDSEVVVDAAKIFAQEDSRSEIAEEEIAAEPDKSVTYIQPKRVDRAPVTMKRVQEKAVADRPVRIRGTSQLQGKRSILGKVVDESGEPMPGVNIMVMNKAQGVVTDALGHFVMSADTGDYLIANFIGYKPKVIKADTSQLLIAMHESTQELSEVVVVGYGMQKKESVTGSVSAVTPDNQTLQPAAIDPEPVIGRRAYRKYLEENLVRPGEGECVKAKGRVKVRFKVDPRGRPYELRVVQSLCETADREAMRLILEGGDWKPGNTEGEITVKF